MLFLYKPTDVFSSRKCYDKVNEALDELAATDEKLFNAFESCGIVSHSPSLPVQIEVFGHEDDVCTLYRGLKARLVTDITTGSQEEYVFAPFPQTMKECRCNDEDQLGYSTSVSAIWLIVANELGGRVDELSRIQLLATYAGCMMKLEDQTKNMTFDDRTTSFGCLAELLSKEVLSTVTSGLGLKHGKENEYNKILIGSSRRPISIALSETHKILLAVEKFKKVARRPACSVLITELYNNRFTVGYDFCGMVEETDNLTYCALKYGIETFYFSDTFPKVDVTDMIPGEIARRYNVVPIKYVDDVLTLAIGVDALNKYDDVSGIISSLRYILRADVDIVVAPKEQVDAAIKAAYPIPVNRDIGGNANIPLDDCLSTELIG